MAGAKAASNSNERAGKARKSKLFSHQRRNGERGEKVLLFMNKDWARESERERERERLFERTNERTNE
jgi:hypothetical protein